MGLVIGLALIGLGLLLFLFIILALLVLMTVFSPLIIICPHCIPGIFIVPVLAFALIYYFPIISRAGRNFYTHLIKSYKMLAPIGIPTKKEDGI